MVHCLETIHRLNAEREAAGKKELKPGTRVWHPLIGPGVIVADNDALSSLVVPIELEPGVNKVFAAYEQAISNRDAEIAMLKEQLAGMEVQVKRSDSARGDATDSFYQWIHGKTMPGSRPSPKECYEAGYNNALAGIPNPEAVRKHETGRLLDGAEYSEFPEPVAP